MCAIPAMHCSTGTVQYLNGRVADVFNESGPPWSFHSTLRNYARQTKIQQFHVPSNHALSSEKSTVGVRTFASAGLLSTGRLGAGDPTISVPSQRVSAALQISWTAASWLATAFQVLLIAASWSSCKRSNQVSIKEGRHQGILVASLLHHNLLETNVSHHSHPLE